MDAKECFEYSTVELLADLDDQLITMESMLSCSDYMNDTIEAVRFNESMDAMDFGSSSTMFDLKVQFGSGVNIADQEQEAIDDQWWKSEEELTMFSPCDLEASQREGLPWSHDHPVLHSTDFLNSCPERRSDLPNSSLRNHFLSDSSDHQRSQGLNFCKSTRAAASRNLFSERKRRTQENKSLYTLRSFVPFITKMDKASIVKDAMTYIQHLQNQVKEIEDDIAALRSNNLQSGCSSSSIVSHSDSSVDLRDMNVLQIHKDLNDHPESASAHPMPPDRSKHAAQSVLQVEACKIEGKTFRIAMYCLKQPGLLVQMTKSLESIQILEVKSSNIISFHDHVVNTVMAKVKEGAESMEADILKQMILHAASEYGFEGAESMEADILKQMILHAASEYGFPQEPQ